MAEENKELTENQEKALKILSGPGNVAIEIAQPVTDIIEEGASWISDAWTNIKETFSGVNYDEAANEAYARRDEIIHDFATQHRARDISPEVMQDMQFLQDSGALEQSGEAGITARISSSFLDSVQNDPTYYGLKEQETLAYNDGKQDITVYTEMSI